MIKGLDITIIISVMSGIWAVYRYFDVRKRDQDLKEFEIYHKLIKELVQPDNIEGMYVDRQAAILYELRNFKRYFSFSHRTLVGLQEKWSKAKAFPRLLDELQLTIKFLDKKIK